VILRVEYAERGEEYGILFIFSLFCDYIQLEYTRIHVMYRDNQAEHGIHILVVAPQEYVNVYSTRRRRCVMQAVLCPLWGCSAIWLLLFSRVCVWL